MPEIDISTIVKDSITAVKTEVGNAFSKLKPFAEHEFRQFAENAIFLSKLKITNVIDNEEFKGRMELQRIAFQNTLLAIKGVGIITAQKAVNAVLGILTKALKSAINVTLPV